MSYMIQTFTFDSPVYSYLDYPFAQQTGFTFAGAQEGVIYLDDADNLFEAATYDEMGQRLLIETELGGTILPEGTVLTYKSNRVSVIQDLQTGHAYYVVFPQQAGASISGMTEIGDRTTVLIIPVTTATPELDPTHSFDFLYGDVRASFSMAATAIPPSYLNPMCFAAGTLIETARGPSPVESLRPGTLILTRDRGLRPLCWAGGRHLSARVLDLAPHLRPIRIRAGALGPGRPAQDLLVSPQHRVLVKSRIARRLTGAEEALVPARHLCAMPGIGAVTPAAGVHYIHLLFDRHEILRSNGCWTESLFTGPQAMRALSPSGRREIRALFPALFDAPPAGPQAARRFMTGGEARELTRRHIKHALPLIL